MVCFALLQFWLATFCTILNICHRSLNHVLYHSNIPGSETGQSYDFSSSDYYELYGDWLDCDYMHGIYFTIPMNSLEIGYNVAELYAQSVKSPLDDWIMLASVDIAIAGETDFTDEVETPVG